MKYSCILLLASVSGVRINNGTSEATPVDHEKVLDQLLDRPDVYSSVDHYKMRGDWAKPNVTLSQAPEPEAKKASLQPPKNESQSKHVVVMTPAGYASAYPENSSKDSEKKDNNQASVSNEKATNAPKSEPEETEREFPTFETQ